MVVGTAQNDQKRKGNTDLGCDSHSLGSAQYKKQNKRYLHSNMGSRTATTTTLSSSSTITETVDSTNRTSDDEQERSVTIHLQREKAPKTERKKVVWEEGTVDNELMNKKSSKSKYSDRKNLIRWNAT